MPLTDAVPSSAADVLLRNASDLDLLVNGTGTQVSARTGKTIRSFAGINQDASDQIARIGFEQPVEYKTSGQTLLRVTQTVTNGGSIYAPAFGATFPFVTSGAFNPALWRVVSSIDSMQLISLQVDNVSALMSHVPIADKQQIFVTSYYAGWAATTAGPQGGGMYVLNLASTRLNNVGAVTASGGGMWEAVFQSGVIDASRFGMKGEVLSVPVFDSGPALNNAILFAAQGTANETGMTISVPSMNYKITTKVLIPSWVTIDFNGSTLTGSGYDPSNTDMFETGFYSEGVITTTIGTPAETKRVIGCKLRNGRIEQTRVAFNFQSFNEGSIVEEFSFDQVGQAVNASRSFYGEFKSLICRGSSGGTELPAYQFSDYVNVENIKSCFVEGRKNGWLFSGGINGLSLATNGAEGLTGYGMKFLGEVKPIDITGNYFEGITGTALDFMDNAQKNSVTIDGNWFYNCGVGISGIAMLSGKIGNGNEFNLCGTNVAIQDNLSTIQVIADPARRASAVDTRPSTFNIKEKYLLGSGIRGEFPLDIYNDLGNSVVSQIVPSRLRPLPFSGEQGFSLNSVPFCSVTKIGTTSYSLQVDTNINFDQYVMYIFKLVATDNSGPRKLCARGYGLDLFR